MSNKPLVKSGSNSPSWFDDFFKPWDEFFIPANGLGRVNTMPPVNITESKDGYNVSVAAPGMKKEDFKIGIDGNLLTIASEKEEEKTDENNKYRRQEYNYYSFSRSFTLPAEVDREKIAAKYEDGVLRLTLPLKEFAKKPTIKQQISVK